MRFKKRKKASRLRGSRTAFYGARKKHKGGSGCRGGVGMAGTGKRAGHRKTFVLKYMYPYFGKKGFTSKKTEKKRSNVINLDEIEKNLESLEKRKIAKKTAKGWELNLKDYKILSRGEIKNSLIINAASVSEKAREKIEKAGGEVIVKAAEQEKNIEKAKDDTVKKEKKAEKGKEK